MENKAAVRNMEAILRAFEIEPGPLDRMLKSFFRKNPAIGSKQRRFISDTLFGLMRWQRTIDAILFADGIRNPSPRQRIEEFLKRVSAIEIDAKTMFSEPAIIFSFPDHIYSRLVRGFGKERAALIASAMNGGGKLVIRANTLKIDRDGLIEVLAREGVASIRTESSPFGLILPERINLASLVSFKEGLFEVQDEGSQMVGLFVAPKGDDLVVDYCAGAGGKALLLAMLMNGNGRIIASDIERRKLTLLKERARIAGADNVQILPVDRLKKDLEGKADIVLVDAPCSGTGTLKRNPDIKWRLSMGDISRRVKEQKEILADASKLVKRGGRLVYVTCSVLPDENEDVADWFRRTFFWEKDGDNFRTDPAIGSMDGFFAAAFRRPRR